MELYLQYEEVVDKNGTSSCVLAELLTLTGGHHEGHGNSPL